jgi:two-component system phosphate regulon sensor histidine kinase PhoR
MTRLRSPRIAYLWPIIGLVIGFALCQWLVWLSETRWRSTETKILRAKVQSIEVVSHSQPDLEGLIVRLAKQLDLGEVQFLQLPIHAPTGSSNVVESDVQWLAEPGGHQRVRISLPLRVSGSPVSQLVLTRRYPSTQIPAVFWLLPFLGLGVGIIMSLIQSYRAGKREQLLHSLQNVLSPDSDPSTEFLRLLSNGDLSDDIYRELSAILRASSEQVATVRAGAEQSETVLSAMPVGILAFTHNLRLSFVNRAGVALLELGSRYREGQRIVELIRQPKVIDLMHASQSSRTTMDGELEVAGGKILLKLRAYPLPQERSNPATALSKPEGILPRMLLIVTDETRLRQLENLRRDFTANVSHELKTPLAAIKAYAETLLMGALDDPDANMRFITRISEQAARLDQLIRDLLQLNRIQSQGTAIELSNISVSEIVKTCVEEHQTIARPRNISVTSSVDDSGIRVVADYEAMRTILGNLLSNAVRYSLAGDSITVSQEVEESWVTIGVTDTGIGIPESDLDRIFERFYRVDRARSQNLGGTGLGLAIVKHLVQALGGTVSVSSQLGKGSEFRFRLKRAV